MRSLKGVSFRCPAWIGLPVVLAVLIGAGFGFGLQDLVRAEAQNPVSNFNEGAKGYFVGFNSSFWPLNLYS